MVDCLTLCTQVKCDLGAINNARAANHYAFGIMITLFEP